MQGGWRRRGLHFPAGHCRDGSTPEQRRDGDATTLVLSCPRGHTHPVGRETEGPGRVTGKPSFEHFRRGPACWYWPPQRAAGRGSGRRWTHPHRVPWPVSPSVIPSPVGCRHSPDLPGHVSLGWLLAPWRPPEPGLSPRRAALARHPLASPLGQHLHYGAELFK